ncbi:tRNA(m(1)G37)methyltransferase [Elasticomyces elasticus]|nr:tRNA(m(1)G37)methyltransferase [Elasticomyces elasticus]KAK3665756.1 tRNA(m(1)G37)methyltransferase [Elasticomyces elasticus]KAK4926327.1 tRNA(m(1)G37)methyltransferase [Elasticomyces elasticus]KAK5757301.1 tRNA(m(1)G37)methyltransferase [Elasticomyces elasticus]
MADDMFRAPLHRGMRALDRSKFQKVVPLKAARIFDNKNISKVRSTLEKSKDALHQDRLGSVHPDPDPEHAKVGRKCVLLRPDTSDDGTAKPHSSTITELIQQHLISIVPFSLHLDYTYWTYHDIISAILPEDAQDEIPSGFSQVGHVAHLNLRDEYLAYKRLIAEILIDKNPGVRTVINKIDDVGEENEFRTFKYEVLAGPDDLSVEVSEENCIFRFDYSKVYWNTRLNTEHRRLVDLFREGQAVCDVMAGIGPFAVPAGKKGVFVWANDLNPDSYLSLMDAVTRNKVSGYVQPYNEDGRAFIRTASARLAKTDHSVNIMSRPSKKEPNTKPSILRTLQQPKTFQHFALNLPASALTFLPSFVGLYPQSLRAHLPGTFAMPLVHVYCFSTKSDDNVAEGTQICEEIGRQLQYPGMKPGKVDQDGEGAVEVFDVRDVAPKKRMFCATFRLPEEVAFRQT